MSFDSNRNPEDYDSIEDDDLTPEEAEWINRCTDAILSADADFHVWLEQRRQESIAAQDADPHAQCFPLHTCGEKVN
jgi:hypothetical protein